MTIELDDAEVEALRQLHAEWSLTLEGSRLPASIVRKISPEPRVLVSPPPDEGLDLLVAYMNGLGPELNHSWMAILVVKFDLQIEFSSRFRRVSRRMVWSETAPAEAPARSDANRHLVAQFLNAYYPSLPAQREAFCRIFDLEHEHVGAPLRPRAQPSPTKADE